MTDGKFEAILLSASANGTYHFTTNQFFAHYARKVIMSPKVPLIIFLVLLALIVLVSVGDFANKNLLWPLGFFSLPALGVGLSRVFAASPTQPEALKQLARWQQARGPLELLITEPQLGEPPPEWKEPDIYDYGVERILIVERDILVDLLVKNNFHSDQRALVISESGYPEYVTARARELLEQSPSLPVFLLHDSTAEGTAMKERLVRSGTLPLEGHPITDLGLFKENVKRLKVLRWRRPQKLDYAVPVDYLAYGFLAAGLGQAVVEGMDFGQLIEQQQAQGGAEASASFG